MNQTNAEIIDKRIGANGPSMGFGVPVMMFGIIAVLAGLAEADYRIILPGIALFLFAAYLIVSIDCISVDIVQGQLNLYKDYFFTKVGGSFHISDYTSVCISYEIDKPFNERRSWNTVQYKTFTVCLVSKTGEKLIVKELGEIDAARKLQFVIASKTGLELIREPIKE